MRGGGAVPLLLLLIGLAAAPAGAAPQDRHAKAMAGFVGDPDILTFLAEEAAKAGVASIKLVAAAEIGRKCQDRTAYGCTTWTGDTRRADIYLNAEKPGGTSVTNITHEIAHAALFRRGCFRHGDPWLTYLMQMAERYEARFPGAAWGKSSPTQSVRAKYERYARERSAC